MGLGLEGAYGADALSQNLRQRVLDELARKQQEFQNSIATRGADRADRALNQQDELTRLKIQELAHAKDTAETDKQFTIGKSLNETLPADTVIPTDSAAVAPLRMIGALRTEQPTLPSTSTVGVMNAPTGSGTISGRLVSQTQNPGNPLQFRKLASAGQQNVMADNARADAVAAREAANQPLEQVIGDDGKPTMMPRSKAAGRTPYHVPPHEPNPQPQIFKGPDGKDHAVQFVGGAAREIPLPDGFSKPNAATANRLSSAQAVTQVGNDIIAKVSQPNVAAMLGPAMGRYNNLQEFVGSPPPEFAELAGDIESFSLANMGVHGMRSVQGADEIKKLLSGKHTPESLIAGLKGLMNFSNHFMENEGRKPTAGTGAKMTADDLIKKYSK